MTISQLEGLIYDQAEEHPHSRCLCVARPAGPCREPPLSATLQPMHRLLQPVLRYKPCAGPSQTRGMVHEMGKGPAHFWFKSENQTRGMVHRADRLQTDRLQTRKCAILLGALRLVVRVERVFDDQFHECDK